MGRVTGIYGAIAGPEIGMSYCDSGSVGGSILV